MLWGYLVAHPPRFARSGDKNNNKEKNELLEINACILNDCRRRQSCFVHARTASLRARCRLSLLVMLYVLF